MLYLLTSKQIFFFCVVLAKAINFSQELWCSKHVVLNQ